MHLSTQWFGAPFQCVRDADSMPAQPFARVKTRLRVGPSTPVLHTPAAPVTAAVLSSFWLAVMRPSL